MLLSRPIEPPDSRSRSPSGGSTLITSAPMSARCCVANGPSSTAVRSITFTPASGPGISLLTRLVLPSLWHMLPAAKDKERHARCVGRPVGGERRAGGGRALLLGSPGGCRRAGDQDRAARGRLRARLRFLRARPQHLFRLAEPRQAVGRARLQEDR